jgi:hypothetical protein
MLGERTLGPLELSSESLKDAVGAHIGERFVVIRLDSREVVRVWDPTTC